VTVTPPDGGGRGPRDSGLVSRASVTNLAAQGAALASVSVASLIVARVGGPAVVGEYALLRVLPWLFGVVFACGLPTATAFFLAGDHAGNDRALRPTIGLMTVAGAGLGALAWLACAGPFHEVFFKQMPLRLVMIAAVLVVTQLGTVTAKGCCQGSGDIAGANLVIVAEEAWFVLVYPAVMFARGRQGVAPVIIALIISGVLATATGVLRLGQRRFFEGWARPSAALARRIAAFGARGQLGNMLWLTNLRFDFVLLGALAGPAVLGIYAVASKFAELMRLAPTAINYVLYPRFARLGHERATVEARRLLPRATALTLILTPFLAAATVVALPVLYGRAFHGAVVPAEIIIIGLSVEGAAAVSSAYLVGCGRPGLNSVGMGVGSVITVTMDVILIPRYGALGGAVTSATAYLAATFVLTFLAVRLARGVGYPAGGRPAANRHRDTALRRTVDVVIGSAALLLVSPLLLAAAVAVRATSPGPALYRQVRAGKAGRPFTMFKFRSMVCDADRRGPLVTDQHDPRITRIGAWLRASKLDELPQLLNVVKGDMTLIGPRPEVPRFLPCYHQDELGILNVRPGLTGPGQIFYTQMQASPHDPQAAADPEAHYVRSELHPKLAVDLDYLRRRCLRTDLGILLHTVALLWHQARREAGPAVTQDANRLLARGRPPPARCGSRAWP
jgi:lipopolysaccharide/colanic/teichoic acid biosynthesis glycosyltransferase/O-antigen/teichoic acid export membrane protein